MTKQAYDAACVAIRENCDVVKVTKTIEDSDGVQEVIDYIDETALTGRIRTTYDYIGGARDWRCSGVDEVLSYWGQEYRRADCPDEEAAT